MEGACGNGCGAVGGDDPELIGLVGLERIEIAGEEDEGALFRIVGNSAAGARFGLGFAGEADADGPGIGECVEQLVCGGCAGGEARDLATLCGEVIAEGFAVLVLDGDGDGEHGCDGPSGKGQDGAARPGLVLFDAEDGAAAAEGRDGGLGLGLGLRL